MTTKRTLSEVQLLDRINQRKAAAGGIVIDNAAISETLRITDTADPIVPSDTAPAAESPTLSLEQIQSLIDSAITPVQQQSQQHQQERDEALAKAKEESDRSAQLETELQEAKATIASKQQELETTQADAKTLEDLGKLMGGTPKTVEQKQPLEILGTGSAEMRKFEKTLQQANSYNIVRHGKVFQQKDTRAADEYWRKNQDNIRDGVGAALREAGFLAGSNIVRDAATLPTDIPHVAFQHLSSYIRQNRFEDLIHWQFANTAAAPGTPPGLNTAVPRYPYMARPTAKSDRILTPGTDTTNVRQNVVEKVVSIVIQELGLGKDTNNAPIALTSFVQAFSMTDLEQIVERNLGMDYQATKDLFLWSEWMASTRIVYNNGNNITTTAADVVPNSVGTATRSFLRKLRAYAKTNKISAFPGGYYGLTLPPTHIANFDDDPTSPLSLPELTPEQVAAVGRSLQQNNGEENGGVVSGLRAVVENVMIFEQNVYGVGNPGDPGVQTVTFGTGVGAKVCDTGFLFGANTIAWATALPVEIRQDDVTDFQRRNSYIWYSHENSGALDVNEDSTTGQEQRVVQVRLLRNKV